LPEDAECGVVETDFVEIIRPYPQDEGFITAGRIDLQANPEG
jgi:hypothetical protein